MAGYLPRYLTRPQTVTHPSTNRARRGVTSLITTNVLTTTVHHAATFYCYVIPTSVISRFLKPVYRASLTPVLFITSADRYYIRGGAASSVLRRSINLSRSTSVRQPALVDRDRTSRHVRRIRRRGRHRHRFGFGRPNCQRSLSDRIISHPADHVVSSVITTEVNHSVIFVGPGRPLPKSHSSCSCCCCCYQFSKAPKIPKALLIHSRAQRNFAYTFMPSQDFPLFTRATLC